MSKLVTYKIYVGYLQGLFDLANFELYLKPVLLVDLMSNQTVELKQDPCSKMASPIGIATQFLKVVL